MTTSVGAIELGFRQDTKGLSYILIVQSDVIASTSPFSEVNQINFTNFIISILIVYPTAGGPVANYSNQFAL